MEELRDAPTSEPPQTQQVFILAENIHRINQKNLNPQLVETI